MMKFVGLHVNRKGSDVIRYLKQIMIMLILILCINTPVNAKTQSAYIKNDTVVRTHKNIFSKKITKLEKYVKVTVIKKYTHWSLIYDEEFKGYVHNKYLTTTEPYVVKDAPRNMKKSCESYTAITNRRSEQYKLQQKAETGKYGIRTVNGRYCIAMGSYYTHKIGQKVDLIMQNGKIIKCIIGDAKADIHTDVYNQKTANGCMSEFIVDMKALDKRVKWSGTMSSVGGVFNQPIKKVRIWNY